MTSTLRGAGMRTRRRDRVASRRANRRLDDRHWLLIGAIVFGLEIVLTVAVFQALV